MSIHLDFIVQNDENIQNLFSRLNLREEPRFMIVRTKYRKKLSDPYNILYGNIACLIKPDFSQQSLNNYFTGFAFD
jgi:hypothetical protein